MIANIKKDGKRKDTERVRAFEASWARLQSDEPGWPIDPGDHEFHDQLISWLTFHRAMFIGEVVPEALRYLRNNPTATEVSAYDHVVVDEYQDLNRADQVLLDLLMSANGMVIGDENQSIYSFRHAHPTGIIEFGPAHSPTHDADLDECRRCPKRVVTLANSLIMHNHNPAGAPKLLPMSTNPDGEVHIVQWNSLAEESKGLAEYISVLTTQKGYLARDILVLTPRRLVAYQLRDAIVARGVAAHSFYHEESLEDDAAQESFAFLSLLVDREDRVSLRFLLGFGSNTWRASEYTKLRAYCGQSGKAPYEALEEQRAGGITISGTSRLIARYIEIVQRLQSLGSVMGEALIDQLFPEHQLGTKILRDAALQALQDDMDASEILDNLRLMITQPEIPEDSDYVRIMSLQKSKGLTAKVTIISGSVQGLIPTQDLSAPPAEQQENLREQRRLFYVSITRPKEILVLSSFTTIEASLAFKIGAQTGSGRFGTLRTIATQFISELGPTAPQAKRGDIWTGNGYV